MEALVAGALLSAFASVASAQDPLEHGFVEPCTMSNVQERHLNCEVCASAFGSRQCEEKLKPRGYSKKCRTRGDHAGWDEIWCALRKPPEEKKDSVMGVVLALVGTIVAMGVMMRVIMGKRGT